VNEVPQIWLFTGIPGAGKSTIARAFAVHHERAAFIAGDALRELVVSGIAWPEGSELEGEALRQYELSIRNQCLLARSFSEAGFLPVLDGVVVTKHHLKAYTSYLAGGHVNLVVLAPSADVARGRDLERAGKTSPDVTHLDAVMRDELEGLGLWVDSGALTAEATLAAVLEDRGEARVA
jgi:adenylylsulfate kinase-like enzyme